MRAWGQSWPLRGLEGCAEGLGAHLALFHGAQSGWHGKLSRTALGMPPTSWGRADLDPGALAKAQVPALSRVDVCGWMCKACGSAPTRILPSAHSPLFSFLLAHSYLRLQGGQVGEGSAVGTAWIKVSLGPQLGWPTHQMPPDLARVAC